MTWVWLQIRTVTTGNYAGVGLAIQKLKDPQDKELPYVYVMNAFEGYAFDAGVRVGDKILTVDGKDLRDASVTGAHDLQPTHSPKVAASHACVRCRDQIWHLSQRFLLGVFHSFFFERLYVKA